MKNQVVFYSVLVITACLFFTACNDKISTNNDLSDESVSENFCLDIQPFNGISEEMVNYVFLRISKILPKVKLNKTIRVPDKAYYKKNNRYKADTIIKILRNNSPKNHITIAMTHYDISTTKGKISDYGIMGLGYQPGKASVVSYFRLSASNIKEQFYKLTLHELGHNFGLPHCKTKTCFMRDAEGGNHADEEVNFCDSCKLFLKQKGWKL